MTPLKSEEPAKVRASHGSLNGLVTRFSSTVSIERLPTSGGANELQ